MKSISSSFALIHFSPFTGANVSSFSAKIIVRNHYVLKMVSVFVEILSHNRNFIQFFRGNVEAHRFTRIRFHTRDDRSSEDGYILSFL